MQTITINPLNHTFFFVRKIIYILLSYLTHGFVKNRWSLTSLNTHPLSQFILFSKSQDIYGKFPKLKYRKRKGYDMKRI